MEQFTIKTEDLCQLYDTKKVIKIISVEGIELSLKKVDIKNQKTWKENIGFKNRQERESGNLIVEEQKTKLNYTTQYDGIWEDGYLIFPYDTSSFFLVK